MFKALVVDKGADDKVAAEVKQIDEAQLPDGDVTVRVEHSTVNYKDGLVLNGLGNLVRTYPHVPGIDFAGTVEASDDPETLLAEITDRLNQVRSPFRTAEAFLIEEIIDPRDTRPLLCEFANLSAPLRTPGPAAVAYRP